MKCISVLIYACDASSTGDGAGEYFCFTLVIEAVQKEKTVLLSPFWNFNSISLQLKFTVKMYFFL